MRKSQSSVEFIILYGTIFLILALVFSTFQLFPSIGTNFEERQSLQYWQTEDIAITSFFINSTDVILSISNNLDDSIELQRIFINSYVAYAPVVEIAPGNSKIVGFSYSTTDSNVAYDISFEYVNLKDFNVYLLEGLSPLIADIS